MHPIVTPYAGHVHKNIDSYTDLTRCITFETSVPSLVQISCERCGGSATSSSDVLAL